MRGSDEQDMAGLPQPREAMASQSPLAGMRLSELIGEVQDRLETVARTQARVQGLLDAFLSVSTGLDLRGTLRRIAQAAADLVDARYGAMGVLRPGGDGLADFITVGIDDELHARMGRLPEGKGVLGKLITHPEPLRVGDLRQHPSSSGFPPHHPPMTSFLGVPVLVRGRVFGNLYMTDKRHGEFTAEDETVLAALAGAAGIAIDNARLYEEGERRRRWLTAISDVRAQLLAASAGAGAEWEAGAPDAALSLMAERVRALTEADATWLLAGPEPDGGYQLVAHSGDGLRDTLGSRFTAADSPVLEAVEAGDGVVALDLSTLPHEGPNAHLHWGPCLAVPLRGTHANGAVLVTVRRAGSDPFDTAMSDLITAFADQATSALDMAARQRLARRVDLFEDRDRIARDLHDHVIQRVFAGGLTLQATLPRIADAEARRRVQAVIQQLDDTVKDIRTSIFALHGTDAADAGDSLRRRLLDIVTETAGDSLKPVIRMSGTIDNLVTGDLAADVEAVVREGVSNASRHSGGTTVVLTVDVHDEVVVEVVDDGHGIDPRRARSGLRNLEDRALRWGGTVSVEPHPDGGTRLYWSAPLSSEQPV